MMRAGKIEQTLLRVHQTQLQNADVKFRRICGYLLVKKFNATYIDHGSL